MAGSVNRAIILGNVGKDPEIRSTQGGMKIANLTVATSETWNDKSSGERKEKVEWHRVSIINDRIVDVVERFVKKGSKIYIEGQIQTRDWTDKDGQKRYTTEINIGRFNGSLVLLDSKREGAAVADRQAPRRQPDLEPDGGGMGAAIGDDIPFAPCF